MSTTVSYKGRTIATVRNETKQLTTSGKWMEANVAVADETVELEDSTVTPSDVRFGRVFYDAEGNKQVGVLLGASADPNVYVSGDTLYVVGTVNYTELDKGIAITI